MEKLVKVNNLKQPNLLINSDFQSGIINQKNATSYSNGGVYTIDMWQILGCGRLALKNENDVQFWRNDTVGGIAQFRQILESTVTGTHTFTVNLKAVTSKVQMYILNSSNEMIKQYVKVGVNTLTYTGSIKEVGMLIEEGDNESCYFNYLKLEKGTKFTGMPLWDKCLELLKCKRYLQVISKHIYMPQFYQNQYAGFSLEVEMAKIPTVYNVKLLDSWDASLILDGTITMTNKNHIDRVFAPSTYNRTYVILHKAIFDAYTY